MDYKKLYEQSLKQRVADEKLIKKLKQENQDLFFTFSKTLKENKELKEEIKELKEEVIVERKKVIEEKENRELAVNMWTAEARFLNMDSAANQEPEEFNEFLKEEYDEEMYKKMYDEFDLKELLACVRGEEEDELKEKMERVCVECGARLGADDISNLENQAEDWTDEEDEMPQMCETCWFGES